MKVKKKRQNKLNKLKGIKYDQDKIMLDLIPSEFIEEVGKVLTFGAKKYTRANWAKGIHFSRLIAAHDRHMRAFNKLNDFDDETGLLHLSHAATNLAFLIWMYYNRKDLDDRWLKNIND